MTQVRKLINLTGVKLHFKKETFAGLKIAEGTDINLFYVNVKGFLWQTKLEKISILVK